MTDETVTLETAVRAVLERKRAVGLPPGGTTIPSSEGRGLLLGTDLEHDELEEWSRAQGAHAIPLMFAHGPVIAAGSLWRDGLLIGIEYQRQRDKALERRVRALAGALEAVAHRLSIALRSTPQSPDVLEGPLTDADVVRAAAAEALRTADLVLEADR